MPLSVGVSDPGDDLRVTFYQATAALRARGSRLERVGCRTVNARDGGSIATDADYSAVAK
ncbi:MAG: hypothetical protein ACLRSW_06085 [Christensenellaceae bacterium]